MSLKRADALTLSPIMAHLTANGYATKKESLAEIGIPFLQSEVIESSNWIPDSLIYSIVPDGDSVAFTTATTVASGVHCKNSVSGLIVGTTYQLSLSATSSGTVAPRIGFVPTNGSSGPDVIIVPASVTDLTEYSGTFVASDTSGAFQLST